MATFHDQFEICARKYSKNNSILFCDNTRIIHKLTYNELLKLINVFTSILEQHVKRNSCVGIFIEPNPLLPALILSIQKHHCAFFCLNKEMFESDIINLVKNIGINIIFIYNAPSFIKSFLSKKAVLIDKIVLREYEYNLELWIINNEICLNYENISYVIQTSGTTGKNKIIKVRHDCIMSNIESLREIFAINDKDVIYFGTPVTFDPFIIEVMLSLTTGACLFIVPLQIKYNRKLLLQTLYPINKNYFGVTFIQMPPSVFLQFSENEIRKMICEESSLKILALGGEKFPEQLFKYKNWTKSLQIFNLYGITEVSCWASIEKVTEYEQNVSLGNPLNNTIFQIRSESGNIVETGEGYLFIGSEKRVCIIGNEIITEKIVFRDTGDIVKLDKNANKIFYVGRENFIIKRLGNKVNLSEIEKSVFHLTQLTSICVWNETKLKLTLFIILQENDNIVKNKIIDKLRIKLLRSLPAAFVPDIIQIIPSIPLTFNGKRDRQCLLQIVDLNESYNNLQPTEVFENLWSKYFGMSKGEIGAQKHNSFLNQGGNSILAIQLISEFDSMIKNEYSGDLMAMLLDHNKNYTNYLDFIAFKTNLNIYRVVDFDLPVSKHKKLNDFECIHNENSFTIAIKWKYNLDACVDSSPVYFIHPRQKSLLALGGHGQKFVILKAKTGTIVTEVTFSDAIESSACITNCKQFIIIGCNDGIIYFVNVENGNVVNKFKTNSAIKSVPMLTNDGQKIIFGSYDKFLYCLNLQGNLEWKFETNESIKSNVIINKDVCFVATIQGSYFCIFAKTGLLKWKYKSNVPIFGSPCIIEEEDIILWADVKGHVICFDCDNGDKLWMYEVSGYIYSSLCQINKKILFSCFDHNVYCLQCTRNGCSETFKINIGAQSSTTPFIFKMNDKQYFIVVNNKGLLHFFDFENQVLQQLFQLPQESFSSPIVEENCIFIGCRDNNVYCLEFKINTNN